MLRFRNKSKPDALLAGMPDWYGTSPATYYISPDEHWIIRDQHVGAGINALFLYRVDTNGQVWRLQHELVSLALVKVLTGSNHSTEDYRHPNGEFVSWDIKLHLVHLKINATPEPVTRGEPADYPRINERAVAYDLEKHTMITN